MILKKEIKYLVSLKQKKFRALNQEVIIEGSKLILDAIKYKQTIKKIIYCSKDEIFSEIRNKAKKNNIELALCSNKDAERISDTKNSQKIFAWISFAQPKKIQMDSMIKKNNFIILDGISDPGNMGTILRTCSWFGYYNIILTDECVELHNPKTIRSAMGAHFHIENIYKDNIQNIIKFLLRNNYEIIAASLNGRKLNKYELTSKNWALVLGNESQGVSEEILKKANVTLTIEGDKKMESLNVAEAGSIIMYQLFNK